MRIFLTGGTGFLGLELLKELHSRNHELTALVRDPLRASSFPTGVRVVRGTIEDLNAYRDSLRNQDVFVHIAALVKMWVRNRKQFDLINVEATEKVLQTAVQAGIGKILYASSFIALGPSNGKPITEQDARRTTMVHNDYERTKYLADQMVRKYIHQGYPIYILYPGVIYGPGNLTDGNIVAKNLIPFLNGTMPFGLSIKDWCYSFVQDVVRGFVHVIETEVPSRRYILGGENVSGQVFYQTLQQVTGKKPPIWNIPLPMAVAAGYGEYLLAELFGREPSMLTHEVARIYKHCWAYDSSLAEREIAYRITPLKEGLRQMIDWLKSSGYIK
jgi:NAD+-dependent farnesol dehydrogenase